MEGVYLGNGWAQRVRACLAEANETVLDICTHPTVPYTVCVLTESSLTLWTLRHNQIIAVGSVQRSPKHLSQVGKNAIVVPLSNNHFAVATDTTCVCVFSMDFNPDNYSAENIMEFSKVDWHDEVSLEIPSFQKINLTYQYSLALPEANQKIISACCLFNHVALATADGHIRFITVNGESRVTYLDGSSVDHSRKLVELSFFDPFMLLRLEHSVIVIQVDSEKFLNYLEEDSSVPLLEEMCFSTKLEIPQEFPIVSMAMHVEKNQNLLALGNSNGNVNIYKFFNISNMFSSTHFRSVSLKEWNFHVSDTGLPSSLAFSASGRCLAVGYSARGLAIWTVQGCRVFSTVPAVCGPAGASELFTSGVLKLAWSQDQHSLIVLGKCDSEFVKIPLLKTVLNESSLLLGDSRVAIWKRLFGNPSNDYGAENDPDFGDWDLIQIHGAYLRDNWPITCACLSPSEEQLAVAGTHGVALFNRILAKWRVFGNVNQEQSITARGICWVGEHILCIVNGNELLFYPRTHLDNRSLIYKEKLAHPCSALDISVGPQNTFILSVFLENGQVLCKEILCYIMDSKTKRVRDYPVNKDAYLPSDDLTVDKISFKLKDIGMSSLADPLEAPTKISLWWRKTAKKDIVLGVLVLFRSGELYLVSVNPSDEMNLSLIASDIEQFWTQKYTKSENFFCTYGSSFGFEIWFANFSLDEEIQRKIGSSIKDSSKFETLTPRRRRSFGLGSLLDSESLFEYNGEVHLLGVEWNLGVVVGAHRGMKSNNWDKSIGSCFSIQTQVQPFADGALRYLVTEGSRRVEDVEMFARSLRSSSPWFFHSLELLLHAVMDYDVFSRVTHSRNPRRPDVGDISVNLEQWMPRVLDFLKRFEEYHDVVANCARKTDFSHWGRLFPLAGTPAQLFEECLLAGKYDVASKYLLILQRYDGSVMAHRQGIRLLNMLNQVSDEQDSNTKRLLLKEVKRFLRMSKRRKESDLKKSRVGSPVVVLQQITEATSDLTEEQKLDNSQTVQTSSGFFGGLMRFLGY